MRASRGSWVSCIHGRDSEFYETRHVLGGQSWFRALKSGPKACRCLSANGFIDSKGVFVNSQTHLLISAALLARPDRPLRNAAVIAGAILPDASIYALVTWAKMNDVPERTIWRELYWQDPWQTVGAITNSVPLFAAGLILCAILLILSQRLVERISTKTYKGVFLPAFWLFGLFFFASCLLHIAFDLPVHAADAHRHFWPLSDWRFHSPLSYWDNAHHAQWVSIFEIGLGLLLVGILFRRFKHLWVRLVLGVAAAAYIVVPIYWFAVFAV